MTLAQIAEAIDGNLDLTRTRLQPDAIVSGDAQTDSREVRDGQIFFAKPGEFSDGHLFAAQAVGAGARLLVVNRPLDLAVPQIVVADTVAALGALATAVIASARAHGSLVVVGITGSNGKTTTKNLLRAILERVGTTVAPKESFNNEVGAPLTMIRVEEDTRFLVSEMGASRLGEIARLARMAKPDIGIVLTVGLAHAAEFGGIESTVVAKTEMVAGLSQAGIAVLNRDDPRVASMAEKTAARIVWFGFSPSADVRADDIDAGIGGTGFTLRFPDGQSRSVRFGVLGEHHVMNALAAAAAAHALAVPADDIVAGLESVRRAERWRMEVLGGGRGVTIINDAYNASADSMAAALKTLAQIAGEHNRTVAVLGEMTELGDLAGEEHDRIGLLAVRLNIDQLVVVGQRAKRIHLSAVKEGSWSGESRFVDTPEEAYELLAGSLKSGDLVLVKASNAVGLRFLGDRLGELFA